MQSRQAQNKNKVPKIYLLYAGILAHEQTADTIENTLLGDPIRRRINRLERAAESNFGKIISRNAHGLLAAFETAEAAVRGACEMQKHCALIPQISGAKVGIQIGIDAIDSKQVALDRIELTETRAYRLANLLGDGGIVVAKAVVDELPSAIRQDIYVISPANVRNLVHAISWRDGPPVYPVATQSWTDFPSVPEQPPPSIVLRLAGVSYKFDSPQAEIMIGRDPTCDIVVDHKKASRSHCKLIIERDKFLLIDTSTNSTYITSSNGAALKVSREQAKLPEKGWITLGHQYHQNSQFRIDFEVIPAQAAIHLTT